nr:hypothetical protein [Tanacetum cinerariifolium]
MHDNIMAAGLRDHPPMLTTRRYAQWQSRFLRYIDTRPNGDALRKWILEAVETLLTMSPENKAHYESEKESIHLLLTRIRDEIYSTIDACKTTHDMWIAIKRLQQGESLNIQDYQKEVNEIRTKRIAKNANPLALVIADSSYPNPYYQAPKSYKSYAPTSKQSSFTISNASTKFKGKEIAKPITPPSESVSEEDSDPEQAQRDKDMQKNLALIAKYFKKIYKPTNNNLRTSSNSKNNNVDTSLRQSRSATDWDIVFQFKEFGHFAKECRKPKRVKDSKYHKEKMLLCKQAEKVLWKRSRRFLLQIHELILSHWNRIMSSSTHHIILYDSDVDDAFSLTNIPNYTPASPNYSPTSPGNTFSDPSENLTQNLLTALAISPFHDDLYMKVMQAYNDELPIQAPIAPPLSPVLSPQFDSRDFFLPKEILPPQKRARFLSHSSVDLAAPPYIFKTEENSHKMPLERHEKQIETILNHLDELPLERIEEMKDKIRARTQIAGLQKKQMGHDDEVVLARVRISTLQMIIEDIQVRHRLDIRILMEAIRERKNNK